MRASRWLFASFLVAACSSNDVEPADNVGGAGGMAGSPAIPDAGTSDGDGGPDLEPLGPPLGAAATIFAVGSASASAGALTLEADPVPDQPGVFLNGPDRQQLPFGNGYLCVQSPLARGKPVHASDHTLSFTYDNSDSTHSLLAFVGTTRYFQAWFRDPAAGSAAFNTSNAIAIAILP